MNLEEARKLARETRRWAKVERGVACAEVVLELADEVERKNEELSKCKEFLQATTKTLVSERREVHGPPQA